MHLIPYDRKPTMTTVIAQYNARNHNMNDEMHKHMRASNALAQINSDNLHPSTAESGFVEHFVKLVCGFVLTRINAENNISHQSHLNLARLLALALPHGGGKICEFRK